MNNEDDNNGYGEFVVELSHFVEERFWDLPNREPLFISRVPSIEEFAEMRIFCLEAGMDPDMCSHLVFQRMDERGHAFRDYVAKYIGDWADQEGFPGVEANMHRNAKEIEYFYRFTNKFLKKSFPASIHYRGEIALVCIEKPSSCDDEDDDPGEDWK